MPVVLLDSDAAGKSVGLELKKELYKGHENLVLSVSDFTGLIDSEIEDLIPSDILIDCLDSILKAENPFAESFVMDKAIVPQIEKWSKIQGIELEEGWKVRLSIDVKKRLISKNLSDFDSKFVAIWEEAFNKFVTA